MFEVGILVALIVIMAILSLIIVVKRVCQKKIQKPKMADEELSRYIYWCIKHENDD